MKEAKGDCIKRTDKYTNLNGNSIPVFYNDTKQEFVIYYRGKRREMESLPANTIIKEPCLSSGEIKKLFNDSHNYL